jgi:hypothetical protein
VSRKIGGGGRNRGRAEGSRRCNQSDNECKRESGKSNAHCGIPFVLESKTNGLRGERRAESHLDDSDSPQPARHGFEKQIGCSFSGRRRNLARLVE